MNILKTPDNGKSQVQNALIEDEDVVEIDPTGRFVRYNEVLGKGTFKTVYRAFDQLEGIEVAWNQIIIKRILESPVLLEIFYSEVRLRKNLKHENIMKFFSWWVDFDKLNVNIITELFTSGSLRQYREKHRKVNMKVLRGWARQILLGLDYLHSHSPPVIHRNLNCDNIFVNGNHGKIKIGDLSLATVMEQSSVHGIIGTPSFMAPEMFDEHYNELVDIYSFGLCMLEMMTFEYPYREFKTIAQIHEIVSSGIKPASLSKVKDPQAKEFIEKCLAPVSSRLSSKELLNDPFLINPVQEVLHEAKINTDHLPPPESHVHVSELELPEYSVDDIKNSFPPFIHEVNDTDENGIDIYVLEVKKIVKNITFELQGSLDDEQSTVDLSLRITNGQVVRQKVGFSFFLASDTALSIASEMAEHIFSHNLYAEVISEMLDSLLINLVEGWMPCVSMDKLVFLDKHMAWDDPNKELYTSLFSSHTTSLLSSQSPIITSSTDAWNIAGLFSGEESAAIEQGIQKKIYNEEAPFVRTECNGDNTVKKETWSSSSEELKQDNTIIDDAVAESFNVNSVNFNYDEEFISEMNNIDRQYIRVMEEILNKKYRAILDARNRAACRKNTTPY